ncbi:hypothetical protein HYALB_00013453 [Hymenoscyphus albidus]|uniref:Cytochrome P450 n=1 Tax=Hymenoscyphus albidus TaxID=595503 RepID=A0A9N9LW71_9HELO|nr:hypothetical protein HYALB_00013453 [Hymenoscyphus albidus]
MHSLINFKSALVAIVLYIFYRIIVSKLASFRNAQKAKALGCEPVYMRPNRLPFGIDHLLVSINAVKDGTFLTVIEDFFVDIGGRHTFSTSVLGGIETLTVEPTNIQAMLATQFEDFDLGDRRRGTMDPFLGSGIFTQDGKRWQHSRAMLRPQFVREQVSDLVTEEEHVQNLFSVLPTPSTDGWTAEVDLQPLFFNLTLDAASQFLLGESTYSQLTDPTSDKRVADFAKCFDVGTRGLSKKFSYGPFSTLLHPTGWKAAVSTCHNFIDDVIGKRLENMDRKKIVGDSEDERNRYVFLEALAQETRDVLELRSQILNILLAGRDTTAATLGWTFFQLVRHPEVYQRLRKIILREFGTYSECVPHRDISFQKLKSCSYLQHTLSETLRLFPVVPWNNRVANKDTSLPTGGGPDGKRKIFVPKGGQISYSVHVMQRRKDLWGEDAAEFKPERWEGRKMGWDFIPFNGGPRICLGQQYAITEASYIIVRLLQRFDDMKNMDPSLEPRYEMGLTVCPSEVKVKMHEA